MNPATCLPRLAATRLFVLDMDGTIYLGDQLFPWTLPFVQRVWATGREVLFLTNNSSKATEDYVAKLNRLGIPVDARHVLTSGQATADALAARTPGARVDVVGTPALLAEFAAAGLRVVEDEPDVVVLGFDTTLTYAKLERLCRHVREGRPFVATHPDLVCPTERGPIPDIGGTLALVEAVTGRRPDEIVGKPNPGIYRAAARKTGVPPHAMAGVGDRLYTDVAGACAAGALAVLVLSGEAQAGDVPGSPHVPDLVVDSLADLTPHL